MIQDISNDSLDYQYQILGIPPLLERQDVTEICINKPGQVYLETFNKQGCIEVNTLTYERARQFCTSVVNEGNTGQRITDKEPMILLTFPSGQCAQFIIPPACDAGKIPITIRQSSKYMKTLEQYQEDGFFNSVILNTDSISKYDLELKELLINRKYGEFFSKAVLYRKNIIVAGATGSGETTFMKSLVNYIPFDERLITIEDARELFIPQPSVVYLLYSRGGRSASNITAKSCMKVCLRMELDGIILAELRDDESFYFVRNCASGHPGPITSCHAGSTDQAWDQLVLMVKASPEGSGLEFNVIKRLLMLTIDIVIHIQAHNGKRYITGIGFDPSRRNDLKQQQKISPL